MLKVGDRVRLVEKPSELYYLDQANEHSGVVTEEANNNGFVLVTWDNGHENGYPKNDLIKLEEVPMSNRKIPSKTQVLEAAFKCPETKEALKILFPDDFEQGFDFTDFYYNPFKYLETTFPDQIKPSQELKDAFKEAGCPIPNGLFPITTINMLKKLFDFFHEQRKYLF